MDNDFDIYSVADMEERMEMLRMHHMQTLWIYLMLILLGIWMILSPLTFSYWKSVVEPSGGRSMAQSGSTYLDCLQLVPVSFPKKQRVRKRSNGSVKVYKIAD